jgi:DNA-binding transcriptional regulator LsrR (DeoR family)
MNQMQVRQEKDERYVKILRLLEQGVGRVALCERFGLSRRAIEHAISVARKMRDDAVQDTSRRES